MEDIFTETIQRARDFTFRMLTSMPARMGEGESDRSNPEFEALHEFVGYWLSPVKHHELVTEDARDNVVERIYRSGVLVEYIHALRYYTLAPLANADIVTIINRLSWAMVRNPTPNNQGNDFCALPCDVSYMQATYETADSHLRHNTWLIPLLLISLGGNDELADIWSDD